MAEERRATVPRKPREARPARPRPQAEPSTSTARRLRDRRLLAAVGAAAAVAIVMAVGFVALIPRSRPVLPPAPQPVAEAPQSSRSTLVLQPPLTLSVKTVSVAGSGSDEPTRFHAVLKLDPPYDVVDATTFLSADTTIRLALLAGLKRDELCTATGGLRYACGLRGRAGLARLIGGRPVVCWPVFDAGSTGQSYRCFADGHDVGAQQAAAGFARTLDSSYAVRQAEPVDDPTADLTSPDANDPEP
jgi:hypothetical protein